MPVTEHHRFAALEARLEAIDAGDEHDAAREPEAPDDADADGHGDAIEEAAGPGQPALGAAHSGGPIAWVHGAFRRFCSRA